MIYKDPLHISWEDLTIRYNQKKYITLNKSFMDKHNAWSNLHKLKEAYWFKMCLHELIEETTDLDNCRSYAEDLQEIEFYIQTLFGFVENKNYHRFWEIPKCTCPVIDNIERIGSGSFIINKNCPIHGV